MISYASGFMFARDKSGKTINKTIYHCYLGILCDIIHEIYKLASEEI